MKNSDRCSLIISAIVIMHLSATPAHAYLDPGTGSAIVTTILGFFAAIAFTVRKYYYKIVTIFRRDGGSEKKADRQ